MGVQPGGVVPPVGSLTTDAIKFNHASVYLDEESIYRTPNQLLRGMKQLGGDKFCAELLQSLLL